MRVHCTAWTVASPWGLPRHECSAQCRAHLTTWPLGCCPQANQNGDVGEEGGSSSSDSSDGEDEAMMDADSGAAPAAPPQRQAPVVDEDGFMMVQGRRRGGR
jgi:hypothetical protein